MSPTYSGDHKSASMVGQGMGSEEDKETRYARALGNFEEGPSSVCEVEERDIVEERSDEVAILAIVSKQVATTDRQE